MSKYTQDNLCCFSELSRSAIFWAMKGGLRQQLPSFRFALLHMQDGVWQGERILPEGWIQFITRPAPANKAREYGAFFWLNAGKKYKGLPEDMYWSMGHYGQVAMIIPSRQLIVVRQGWSQLGGFDQYIEQVMQRILAAARTPPPK